MYALRKKAFTLGTVVLHAARFYVYGSLLE